MKKIFAISMSVLIICLCFIGVLAETWLSKAEAIHLATQAVTKQVTISDEDFAKLEITTMRNVEDISGKTVCVVEFNLPLEYCTCCLYSVSLDEKTGEIVDSTIPQNAFDEVRRNNEGYKVMQELEKEKGSMYYWGEQETVDFFNNYFDGGYKMPEQGDLSRDDAIDIAKRYAKDNWQMTDEYLNGLPVCANLTTGDVIGDSADGSCWYVYFVDESICSSTDGIVSPHMVTISNPSGEVLGGAMGDSNGVG